MKEENQDGAGLRREIKFRAWDTVRKMMEKNPHIADGSIGDYQVSLNEGIEYVQKKWDLILMQFAGLKDKNGRDIYEGDVIEGFLYKWSLATMGEIVFSAEHGSWANKNEGGITLMLEIGSIAVLGNIYENPDLLGASARGEQREPQPDPSNIGPQGQQGEQ